MSQNTSQKLNVWIFLFMVSHGPFWFAKIMNMFGPKMAYLNKSCYTICAGTKSIILSSKSWFYTKYKVFRGIARKFHYCYQDTQRQCWLSMKNCWVSVIPPKHASKLLNKWIIHIKGNWPCFIIWNSYTYSPKSMK